VAHQARFARSAPGVIAAIRAGRGAAFRYTICKHASGGEKGACEFSVKVRDAGRGLLARSSGRKPAPCPVNPLCLRIDAHARQFERGTHVTIHNQQLKTSQVLLKTQQALFITGFHEFVHARGRGSGAHAITFLTSGQSDGQRNVRFFQYPSFPTPARTRAYR